MKTTLDLPDDLYRQVKARSALEGRPVREVAVKLFRAWIDGESPASKDPSRAGAGSPAPPAWFGSLREYASNAEGRHDMESVRASIARGRRAELRDRKKPR